MFLSVRLFLYSYYYILFYFNITLTSCTVFIFIFILLFYFSSFLFLFFYFILIFIHLFYFWIHTMNCIQLLLDFSQDRTGQAQLCNKLFPFYFSLFHINYTSYYFIYYVVSYHIISCMKSQSSASMKSRQASLSLLDIALFSRFCITFYDSPKWPTEIQLK